MIFRARVATEDVLWSNNDFLDYSATGPTAYKEPAGFLQTMDNKMIHSTWKKTLSLSHQRDIIPFADMSHKAACSDCAQDSVGAVPTVWGWSLSFQGTHFATDMIGYASTLC